MNTEPNTPSRRKNPRQVRAQTAQTAGAVTADAIAQRAYALYLTRGREDGHDLDDWLAAERELTGQRQSVAND